MIIIKYERIYSDSERIGNIKRLLKDFSLETTIKGILFLGIFTPILFFNKDKHPIFTETILYYILPILILGGTFMFIYCIYLLLSGKYINLHKDILESDDIINAYIDLLNKGDLTSLKSNYEDEFARPLAIPKVIGFGYEKFNYYVIPFASNENLDLIIKDEVFNVRFYKKKISKETYYELVELHKNDIDKYREEISKYNFFEYPTIDLSTY